MIGSVTVASLLFGLPGLFVVSRSVSPLLFAATVLGVEFLIQFGAGVYYVYSQELADESTDGTILAVFTTIAFIKTLLSPAVGGWLIDMYSWTVTFVVYETISCVGIVALLLDDRHPAERS